MQRHDEKGVGEDLGTVASGAVRLIRGVLTIKTIVCFQRVGFLCWYYE